MFCLVVVGLFAQGTPDPLPMNPKVRVGKLDNGLTYYLMHNDEPEHRAEFYIAQKVGSVLEEESQRGLAHFLEHMAFNGTKNFPGKGLLEYLQKNGVKFGANVNAYTSIDETVYNISDVPTTEDHPHIIDSCLLILHDWSGYISLLDEEIDNERGVIHEEWRSRNSALQQMYTEQLLPKFYGENRYGHRMPIGLMSVVDNFKYQEIKDYYQKWYRPDLQGIIVVGDINVDEVEAKIKDLWKDIQTPADAAPRTYFQVEDNKEPVVFVAKNPEFQGNQISIMYKKEILPVEFKRSVYGYLDSFSKIIISSVINQRLSEIARKADAPFIGAQVGFGTYIASMTKDCFEIDLNSRDSEWKTSLMAVMNEVRGAIEHGLTDVEVERVKENLLSNIENAYNQREKAKNASFVKECQDHFLNDSPMPGIEYEWTMLQQLMPMLTAQTLNQMLPSLITEENLNMYMVSQEKEGNAIPTEEELLAAYKESLTTETKAHEEEAVSKTLIEKLPKPGKIKKEFDGPLGSKGFVLSNGVKVIYKESDLGKNQVSMSAISYGGTLLKHRAENPIVRQSLSSTLTMGGLGDYDSNQLRKVLSGKQANVGLSIGGTTESISGSATPKDLRTMFELLYLRITAPRQDYEYYNTWMQRNEISMKNQEGTPEEIINDSLTNTLYVGNPYIKNVKAEDLKALNYDRDFQWAKERFANAADFTFYFIGNIDVDSLKAYCCQYIATLPANKKFEKKPEPLLMSKGSRENRFDVAMESPKTSVQNIFTLFDQKWNIKDDIAVSMLGQIASMVFTETIREREGGVYSPGAQGSTDYNVGVYQFAYFFDTGADKCAHIEKVAYDEFAKLAQSGGIREDMFQKTRDFMLKRYASNIKENNFWFNAMINQDFYKVDTYTGYEEALNSITVADIEAMAARFVKEADRIQFISNGIEKK